MRQPLRLAVLLSGGGTTLQNFLDRSTTGRMPWATVVTVIASNPSAYGLTRATNAGLPTMVVERKTCPNQQEFSTRIFDVCRAASADVVCLAGFLQLLVIPHDWAGRVLNIHPSLLPAFGGKGFHGTHVHQAALEMGVKVSGCTVHFADDRYDTGPIILQRVVPVLDDDIPNMLAARVFAAECEAYPDALRLYAENRLRIEGRRVRTLPE
jgi:phosphoribosylglycinamide formyltransferase 1